MNPQQGLEILVKAVQQATLKGAYTLEDTKVINQAIDALVVKAPVEKPEETKDDKNL